MTKKHYNKLGDGSTRRINRTTSKSIRNVGADSHALAKCLGKMIEDIDFAQAELDNKLTGVSKLLVERAVDKLHKDMKAHSKTLRKLEITHTIKENRIIVTVEMIDDDIDVFLVNRGVNRRHERT
jgi:hypothetical protein